MSLAIGAALTAGQQIVSLISNLMQPQPSPGDAASGISQADLTPAQPGSNLTGSPTAQLSSDTLSALTQLQNQAATPGSTPLQTLFNAMDTDGDGSVSEGEMESYVQNAGGTKAQADTLYNDLDTNGATGGVSESQMAGALQSQRAGGAHHHHHHGGGGSSTDQDSASTSPLDQLMAAIDGTSDATDPSSQGSNAFVSSVLDAFAKADPSSATSASTTSITV